MADVSNPRDRVRQCKGCGTEYQDIRVGKSGVRLYCTLECREDAERRRTEDLKLTYGQCDIEGCEKRKRSRTSPWCEMHYGRNRFNGSPHIVRVRKPNRTCYHCEAAAPKGRLFCSDVCQRRDRLGIPGRQLQCTICDTALPEDVRSDALYCSDRCQRLNERAGRYGITGRHLWALMRDADGCMICGSLVHELVVDHCHDSGAVRGLLCSPCNVAIGMFKDDPSRLQAAISYLQRFDDAKQVEQSSLHGE